jgi:AmiR/NasT family two-component response regulator
MILHWKAVNIVVGEKYIIAAAENPIQISVRNILNPLGYTFLGNCNDPISFMRLIRSVKPDFIILDTSIKLGEFRRHLETVDDEMLCACVIMGEYKDADIISILESSRVISFCPKPLNRQLLIHTVDMGLMNYRRVSMLSKKLKEVTESYETRETVERAKRMLMRRDRLSENEAYEIMRKKSMDTRSSLKSVAEDIILAHGAMGKSDGQ